MRFCSGYVTQVSEPWLMGLLSDYRFSVINDLCDEGFFWYIHFQFQRLEALLRLAEGRIEFLKSITYISVINLKLETLSGEYFVTMIIQVFLHGNICCRYSLEQRWITFLNSTATSFIVLSKNCLELIGAFLGS